MASRLFDADILGPIVGRGADDPASLWELLSSVDAAQQTFIAVDHLHAGLGRLAAEGRIRELPGHPYVDAASGAGSANLAPITEPEWHAGLEEYQREFERLNADANQPYPRLTVAYAIPVGAPPTDADVQGARDLRDRMTSALSAAGVTSMTGEVVVDGSTVVV